MSTDTFVAVPLDADEDEDYSFHPLDPSVRVFLHIGKDAFGGAREYLSFGPKPDEHLLEIFINDTAAALTLVTAILHQLNGGRDDGTVEITLRAQVALDDVQCEPLTPAEAAIVKARWDERMETSLRRKSST